MNLSNITVAAKSYKRLSLYGRDLNDIAFESDYLSGQAGSQGCWHPFGPTCCLRC